MKFLVDMPLSPTLAAWLRDQAHDAVHAADVGLARAADAAIVLRAKQEGRTVVTADLDYPRLLALARSDNPSLILFRDGNWRDDEVIARMADVLRSLPDSDLAQSMIVVERDVFVEGGCRSEVTNLRSPVQIPLPSSASRLPDQRGT